MVLFSFRDYLCFKIVIVSLKCKENKNIKNISTKYECIKVGLFFQFNSYEIKTLYVTLNNGEGDFRRLLKFFGED